MIAVDPSKGKEGQRGDYSAIVFTGLSGGLIWVDSSIERRPVEKLIGDGISMAVQYQQCLRAFGVEINQFQELLVGEFERQAAERGVGDLFDGLIHTLTNTVNKKLRISRLGPLFAQQKLRFKPTPSNRLLIDQCKAFSMRDAAGVHDDGPDGLEMAVRILNHLLGAEVADDGLGFTETVI